MLPTCALVLLDLNLSYKAFAIELIVITSHSCLHSVSLTVAVYFKFEDMFVLLACLWLIRPGTSCFFSGFLKFVHQRSSSLPPLFRFVYAYYTRVKALVSANTSTLALHVYQSDCCAFLL